MREHNTSTNVQNLSHLTNNFVVNPILFNIAKIDSFAIKIPLDSIDVVSSTFLQKYKKVYKHSEDIVSSEHNGYPIKVNPETGEEIEFECSDNCIRIHNDKTKTFLRYEKQTHFINGEVIEYIIIVVTSKLLLKNYFNGINLTNINVVYDYIINDKVIDLSFEQFLNSGIYDIDLCKDYRLDLFRFKDLRSILRANVLDEKRNALLPNNNKVESYGVQFKTRRSSTLLEPFVKWYFKSVELDSEGTKEFSKMHLYPYYTEDISNGIVRCEATIKNKKHKKKLGIENVNTLRDFLNLSQDVLNELHKKIIKEYYERDTLILKNKDKMNRKDLLVSSLIDIILDLDSKITTDELIFRVNQRIDYNIYDANMKGRIKSDILIGIENSSYSKRIKKQNEKSSEVLSILYDVGVFNLEDKP